MSMGVFVQKNRLAIPWECFCFVTARGAIIFLMTLGIMALSIMALTIITL